MWKTLQKQTITLAHLSHLVTLTTMGLRVDDLAVGVPFENFDGFSDSGIVQVIYGSSSGLSTSTVLADQLFILADDASPGNNDLYGLTLSTGDFTNGEGDDLAVGAPNKSLGSSINAGIVHVLYGLSTGLGNNLVFANHILAQGMNGLDDIIETDDKFGTSLSSADFNGDGSADLAVGLLVKTLMVYRMQVQ